MRNEEVGSWKSEAGRPKHIPKFPLLLFKGELVPIFREECEGMRGERGGL